MLKEPVSSPDYQPKPDPYTFEEGNLSTEQQNKPNHLRELLLPFLAIAEEGTVAIADLSPEDQALIGRNAQAKLIMSYSGFLKQDAEIVYKALDKELVVDDLFPLLRETPNNPDAPHIIHIIEGRPTKPRAWSVWPNVILFILTVLSVLFTGATLAIGEIGLDDPAHAQAMSNSLSSLISEMWRGWPYALSILLILVPHEMGHYLMMRRHGLQASLPFFIPAWLISPFGTFGAAIVIRESLKNRKTLLDVGAAGPIAGFIVAVPIVFIGLATSRVIPMTPGGYIEGNSLIYIFAKLIIFGEILPNGQVDVLVNQLAWAGWTGLFVTALNMLPVGQLDGGHVLYSLLGHRARLAYWPVLIGLVGLSILFWQMTWGLIWLMLFFFGRFYAVPLNDITPLDKPRRWIGIAALIIFVLSFTPVPLYINDVGADTLSTQNAAFHIGIMAVTALIVLPRWWKMRQLMK
jgi:membrane-associated protease RseP (regulator of RpoE activity)